MAANRTKSLLRRCVVALVAAVCLICSFPFSALSAQTPPTPQQTGSAVAPVQKPGPAVLGTPKTPPSTPSEQPPSPPVEQQPPSLQEELVPEVPAPQLEPFSVVSYAKRMAVVLLIVIALICLAIPLLKRITRGMPMFFDQRLGRVIGTIPLGARAALYLVKVADRVLVVGVSPTAMTLLAEITDPETVQELERSRHEGVAAKLPFGNYLSQSRAGFSGDQRASEEEAKLEEHLRDIKDQMAKLSALIGGSEGEKER